MATTTEENNAPLPIFIPEQAELGLVEFQRACLDSYAATSELREHFEQIDKDYYREKDQTLEERRAAAANAAGDSSKFRNVTVPIVYPQVEEAVTYQTDVFLTGHPIFSCVAPPSQMDAARQMNIVIEENSIRGGWVREFMMAFRDGFKYNLLGVEATWDTITTAAIETDVSAGAAKNFAKVKNVVWSGNVINRIDPYNLIYDRRYNPAEVCTRGEYAGYSLLLSRTELKTRINNLPYKIIKNIRAALEAGTPQVGGIGDTGYGYYVPQYRRDGKFAHAQTNSEQFDWSRWVNLSGSAQEFAYKNFYIWTVIYARIIPADFKLRVAAANTPQIWKLIYVNNSVLICAERMTNIHNYLPIILAQPHEDGAGIQSKSLAETVGPYQDLSSAMMNSVVAARRRAISDRMLYNPSLVSKQHIESSSASAKIPVRPAAYGRPLSEAVFPFPFRDDQSGILMGQMPQILSLADLASGQNRARRGQFQKGNKTLHEFQTVMDGSSGRDQLTAISLEAQLFRPIKHIIKANILQYQGTAEIFSATLNTQTAVDPVALRNAALDFKVSDGLTPTAKLISSDTLSVALQTIASSPTIGASYNVGPMFSYLMSTQNADLKPFEKSQGQVAFEQAMGAWNQAAQMAAEKGLPFNSPQPVPQAYGWNPNSPADQQQQPQPAQPAQPNANA